MGDILTPFILSELGYEANWVHPNTSNKLIAIGSTAKFVRSGDIVWGTGIMWGKDPINQDATYLAVRGPITGQKVNCNTFGDAGLLCSRLFPFNEDKNTDIGVIPHYVDYKIDIGQLYKINIINENPIEVAHQIASCKRIISSSLHGIIVAHSYGIPAAWWKPSNKLDGDGSKFEDYAASVDIDLPYSNSIDNVIYTLPDLDKVYKIQNNLLLVLKDYLDNKV
jgi:hypothetical protein